MKQRLTLGETKAVLLDCLKEFDHACSLIGVDYWLAAGTALGAVRHKGFIPWDDDVDVFMLRADYERFCRLYIDHDQYVLKTVDRDKGYPYGFAKLCNMNTVFIQDVVALDCDMGAFVDIFPLDYIEGDAESPNKSYLRAGIILTKMYWYAEILKHNRNNLRRQGIIKWSLSGLAHILTRPFGRKRLLNLLEGRFRSFSRDNQEYCMLFWGRSGIRDCLRTEWTKNTVMLEFEGQKFPVFADWDGYLTQAYGDYLTPPANPTPPHGQLYWR